MIKTVIATFKEVGFHCWPDAPAEVSYLSNPHRHEFLIRVEARVGHDDREIEFHMLKREAKLAMITAFDAAEQGSEFQFGHRSCEMIAQHLYASIRYPVSAIEVWEDQENGARVEFV
jgi:hypothetical protein